MRLMISSSNTKKFVMKEIIEPSDIIDFKNWWPQFYKKNAMSKETNLKNVPRNEKAYFNFAKNKKGEIKLLPFLHGLQFQTFQLGQPGKIHVQPTKKYYASGFN